MGRIDRQKVGPLYRPKRVQDPIQVSSSPIGSSDKSESIFLPVIARKDRRASQERAVERLQNPGTPSFYSRLFLVPKKNGKLRPVIDVSLLNQNTDKQHFKMETVVSKTIDNSQRLGCLHRSDGCIFSCTDTADIQKIPSVRLRTAGLSVHGLTLRNVPPWIFTKLKEVIAAHL